MVGFQNLSDLLTYLLSMTRSIELGRTGVATATSGNFYVKNVGTRACELDGFSTVQLIGGANQQIPTIVTFGSDYTMPAVPARSRRIKSDGPTLNTDDSPGRGSNLSRGTRIWILGDSTKRVSVKYPDPVKCFRIR